MRVLARDRGKPMAPFPDQWLDGPDTPRLAARQFEQADGEAPETAQHDIAQAPVTASMPHVTRFSNRKGLIEDARRQPVMLWRVADS